MSSVPPVWHPLVPYAAPTLGAAAAIVPVFYGFMAKSACQLSKPLPYFRCSLKEGLKAAPTTGLIIGAQIVAQKLFEETFHTHKEANWQTMLSSSIIIGTISSPLLAIFNGQTARQPVMNSLRALSVKQTGAIIIQEISFLYALRMSKPLSLEMKQLFGDHRAIEYAATFCSGAIGSLAGHPADTALTLWQAGKKIEHLGQLSRGALWKSVALGGFFVVYKAVKESIESLHL